MIFSKIEKMWRGFLTGLSEKLQIYEYGRGESCERGEHVSAARCREPVCAIASVGVMSHWDATPEPVGEIPFHFSVTMCSSALKRFFRHAP